MTKCMIHYNDDLLSQFPHKQRVLNIDETIILMHVYGYHGSV